MCYEILYINDASLLARKNSILHYFLIASIITKQIQPARFRCVISNFSVDAIFCASPESCIKRAPDLHLVW